MMNNNFNLINTFPEKEVKQYVVHGSEIKEVPGVTILMGPAGALWSGSGDMVRFLQLFLNDGRPLYPASVIHEMETSHSSLAAKAGLQSGYGLANTDFLFYNKYPWRGHGGLLGTCFSTCIYNREMGVGFVVSSNGNQQNTVIEKLIADYLEQQYPG